MLDGTHSWVVRVETQLPGFLLEAVAFLEDILVFLLPHDAR